jgi:hypothetical protein
MPVIIIKVKVSNKVETEGSGTTFLKAHSDELNRHFSKLTKKK